MISTIVSTPVPKPGTTQFRFTLDHDTANHNAAIFQQHGYDFTEAINSNGSSPLNFGSEFRDTAVLAPLFRYHPNWPRAANIINHGSHFQAEPLPPKQRLEHLEAALAYGNHKGAVKAPDQLFDLLSNDIVNGFAILLPLELARLSPGILLSSMNIARQNTIDHTGRVIEKDRLTHYHSFDFFKNGSINSRSNLTAHEACMFGNCIIRICHIIVNY
jgi:hypothetical protein